LIYKLLLHVSTRALSLPQGASALTHVHGVLYDSVYNTLLGNNSDID